MQTDQPLQRDLLLVGGGHSHVEVIRQLGMEPLPGVRVTLLTRDATSPYSGMLPGWIAGHYTQDACFIDLRRLCQWAGVRLLQSAVHGIDPQAQRVHCQGRPPIRYDWLSLNVGSTPALSTIGGASQFGIPVKPIEGFQGALQAWLEALPNQGPPRLACVIGGGAASVELVLAIQHRLTTLGKAGQARLQLISAEQALLPRHNRRVGTYFKQLLQQRGISLALNQTVTAITAEHIQCQDGSRFDSNFTVVATHAGAPPWLAQTGLALDKDGFVEVNDCLQSTSHPQVFASGDCASLVDHVLPKSGVYAVRQGPILADNLRRTSSAQSLRRYHPQRRFLALLATGDRRAVASRGSLFAAGGWVWRWKSRIDLRFMARYNELPAMQSGTDGEDQAEMRCGGCGAKVGGDTLMEVLGELQQRKGGAIPTAEDAALVELPPGRQLVQTVDHFRAFIDDPYLLGRIGANHCLGDIYAMGATPASALALANVPYAHPRIVRDTLYQLMRGALDTLAEAGTVLLGGHTAEAAELAFGLTVNGHVAPGTALLKGGLTSGQVLLLCKPLGTGTLLAANMRHEARGQWIETALATMQQSCADAAIIFREHGATACTDITGFGLLGHLLEMLDAAGLGATLQLDSLPLLPGAEACLERGITSSFHPHNQVYLHRITNADELARESRTPILCDPQTAGGLLAGIPAANAEACLRALDAAGYQGAAIGTIHDAATPGVTLR